jgi:Protein of unknown function (DUF3592)
MIRKHLISLLFIALGAFSVFIGYRAYKIQTTFLAKAKQTTGIVTDIQKSDETITYIIQFTDPKGNKVQFESGTDLGDDITTGNTVDVLYDPEDPSYAQLGSHKLTMAKLFIIIGGVFFILGFVKRFILDKRKGQQK